MQRTAGRFQRREFAWRWPIQKSMTVGMNLGIDLNSLDRAEISATCDNLFTPPHPPQPPSTPAPDYPPSTARTACPQA